MGTAPRRRMPPKKVKDVMVPIENDAAFKDATKTGCCFMEVYSNKWGQCQCYKTTTQKMYFRFMDHMKFHKVAIDDVKILAAESQFEALRHHAQHTKPKPPRMPIVR